MHTSELTTGRIVGVTFDHGDDFFTCLGEACRSLGIRQGYIPVFIAGFSEARIVGACDKLDDPGAPVWSSVHVTNIEALGGGTLRVCREGSEDVSASSLGWPSPASPAHPQRHQIHTPQRLPGLPRPSSRTPNCLPHYRGALALAQHVQKRAGKHARYQPWDNAYLRDLGQAQRWYQHGLGLEPKQRAQSPRRVR